MDKDEDTPKIEQVGDAFSSFKLKTGDGREFELGVRLSLYSSFAALDSMYGPFPVLEDQNKIPIEIAAEGSAALATYMMLVLQTYHDISWKESLNEVATRLDVQEYTVRKYLKRVRDRC
jgi:hypothetical protein